MIPRVLPDDQLELFAQFALYLTQTDVAARLGVSVRVIQYWEQNGLLHPERPTEGKIRKYTRRDLVELSFIRTMIVEQGFTVPSLKDKLKSLEAPYYYDGRKLFWDLESNSWKTKAMIAAEEVTSHKETLRSIIEEIQEELPNATRQEVSVQIVSAVRNVLSGSLNLKKRRRRKAQAAIAVAPKRKRSYKKKTQQDTLFEETSSGKTLNESTLEE